MEKNTVLATAVQTLRSSRHQILLLPCSRSALLEMLHILLHHSAAPTPASINIPHVKINFW